MDVSDPSRDTVSKGSTANGSLSSKASWADDCDCYCQGWLSRGGSPERLACPLSCREV